MPGSPGNPMSLIDLLERIIGHCSRFLIQVSDQNATEIIQNNDIKMCPIAEKTQNLYSSLRITPGNFFQNRVSTMKSRRMKVDADIVEFLLCAFVFSWLWH